MKLKLHFLFLTIGLFFLTAWGGYSQQLYVGDNDHPHDDKNPGKIKSDVQLMKAGRFRNPSTTRKMILAK